MINEIINIKRVIAVVLSFVNLFFSFFSFIIIYEYLEMFVKNTTYSLEFHNMCSDIFIMFVGVVMFIYSLFTIIKYFRHKKINFIYPVLFLIFYFIAIFLPF